MSRKVGEVLSFLYIVAFVTPFRARNHEAQKNRGRPVTFRDMNFSRSERYKSMDTKIGAGSNGRVLLSGVLFLEVKRSKEGRSLCLVDAPFLFKAKPCCLGGLRSTSLALFDHRQGPLFHNRELCKPICESVFNDKSTFLFSGHGAPQAL